LYRAHKGRIGRKDFFLPTFHDFRLLPATLAVLANMEIIEPTPVQAEAIPALMAGKDVVGQSATGSGKTLAYGIPLVERVARDKRVTQALVLAPTRELAIQVNTVLVRLSTSRRLTTALLVGGRPYGGQISALRYGAQIVVGTPGRVKDHLDRGTLVLSQLRMCVLDEADEMLDIGFAPAIEEILETTPDTRQMALFSATIPDWIEKLQQKFLKEPVKIDITHTLGEQSTIEQIAYQVPQNQKMAALCTLLQSTRGESSLIFGKTKYGVEKLGKQLDRLGFTVGTLHGNKSQSAREKVLTAFRQGQVQTLLATNVAARGLDITGIYQVINYELPESSDLFTHRIGRTGRMGRQGKAITLLVPSDVPKWRRMARNLGQTVALQRLAIDEEAIVPLPIARPEAPVTQEQKQNSEQREQKPVRDDKQVSPDQDRERGSHASNRTRPKHDSYNSYDSHDTRGTNGTNTTSDFKRQQKERDTGKTPTRTPARQPKGFTLPERPYSDRARVGRREVGNQSSFNRSSGKHKTRAFAATQPPHPRRKPGAARAERAARAR
jgi:ATP-dependent RNA helicase DeaD